MSTCFFYCTIFSDYSLWVEQKLNLNTMSLFIIWQYLFIESDASVLIIICIG